jgi:Type IV secretion system pilin
MKNTKKILIYLAIFLVLIVPMLSFAYKLGDPLVPSCTPKCSFNDLMTLVNNVITFILYYMAVPIAAIMFAYAGFLMVTAGGEAAGARTKAKGIFFHAVIGLIIAVAAFLIIKLILSILGYTDAAWIGF